MKGFFCLESLKAIPYGAKRLINHMIWSASTNPQWPIRCLRLSPLLIFLGLCGAKSPDAKLTYDNELTIAKAGFTWPSSGVYLGSKKSIPIFEWCLRLPSCKDCLTHISVHTYGATDSTFTAADDALLRDEAVITTSRFVSVAISDPGLMTIDNSEEQSLHSYIARQYPRFIRLGFVREAPSDYQHCWSAFAAPLCSQLIEAATQPISLTDQNGFFRGTFGPELEIGDMRYIAPLPGKVSALGLPFYVDCNLNNLCRTGQNEFFLTSFNFFRDVGISYEFFSEPTQDGLTRPDVFPESDFLGLEARVEHVVLQLISRNTSGMCP